MRYQNAARDSATEYGAEGRSKQQFASGRCGMVTAVGQLPEKIRRNDSQHRGFGHYQRCDQKNACGKIIDKLDTIGASDI